MGAACSLLAAALLALAGVRAASAQSGVKVARAARSLQNAPRATSCRLLDLREEALAIPGSRQLAGIRVRARLGAPIRTTTTVRIAILADTVDDRSVGSENIETVVGPGESIAEVTLPGDDFRRLRRDGPYRLHVSVDGADDQVILWTRAYRWKRFSARTMRPDGTVPTMLTGNHH
ncbi:MAG TPA: hypothetical protein VFI79_04665 [Gemmatimonadales bacterium]|nr:hypothetical protein [Gemmatimonadales bacterium]